MLNLQKKIHLLLVLMIPVCSVHGQNLMDIIDPTFRNKDITNLSDSKIEGNPYLFDDFKNGSVYAKNKVYTGQLNYDILNQLVTVKNGDVISSVNTKMIESFTIEGSKFKKINEQIYQCFTDSISPQVLIAHKKTITHGTPGNSYASATPDKISYLKKFYLFIDQRLIEFSNEKSLIKKLTLEGKKPHKRIRKPGESDEVHYHQIVEAAFNP
jgi:hypothetical protein